MSIKKREKVDTTSVRLDGIVQPFFLFYLPIKHPSHGADFNFCL